MRTRRPNPRRQLVEILFGAYRRQLIGLLLLRPHETFCVREIARATGVPAGSLYRELKTLTDAGLLARTVAGNQVRYQANRSCAVFEELAALFRKTMEHADATKRLCQSRESGAMWRLAPANEALISPCNCPRFALSDRSVHLAC